MSDLAASWLAFAWHVADLALQRQRPGKLRVAVSIVGVGWSAGWLAYRLQRLVRRRSKR